MTFRFTYGRLPFIIYGYLQLKKEEGYLNIGIIKVKYKCYYLSLSIMDHFYKRLMSLHISNHPQN